MPSKSKESRLAKASLEFVDVVHRFFHICQVSRKYPRAVHLDGDRGTHNRDLLEIPVTNPTLITALGCHHAIGGSMVLRWVKFSIFLGGVIQHLQFTHAHIRCVAAAGIADGQAIVAARRHLVLEPDRKVG